MPTPDLLLQPSRQWSGLLILLHLGAFYCVLFSCAPIGIILIAGLACLCSLVILLRDSFLWSANAIVRVWVTEDGQWRLQNRDGAVRIAKLRGDSLVSQFLIILNFKAQAKRRNIPVILMADSTDACTLRRLKQYLYTEARVDRDDGQGQDGNQSK